MKTCPYCAEEIQDEAIKCKHCGEFLDGPGSAEKTPMVKGSAFESAGHPAVSAAPPTQTETNGRAIAALVLGIVWMYGIGSILALVFGYSGKAQIDRSRGRETGRGMAVAGIVLGWIGVASVLILGALLVAGLTVVANRAQVFESARLTAPTSALGVLTTEAPWDANAARSAARARALGLPAEGTTLHIHSDLQIFVHGQQEPVPVNIGITDTTIQSLHTHDASGTIYMESSVARTFRLGELFDVWGVRLTPSCLGAYCNGGGNTLQVFVNGQEQTGDPTQIAMNDQDIIVVTYGTPDELPDLILSAQVPPSGTGTVTGPGEDICSNLQDAAGAGEYNRDAVAQYCPNGQLPSVNLRLCRQIEWGTAGESISVVLYCPNGRPLN